MGYSPLTFMVIVEERNKRRGGPPHLTSKTAINLKASEKCGSQRNHRTLSDNFKCFIFHHSKDVLMEKRSVFGNLNEFAKINFLRIYSFWRKIETRTRGVIRESSCSCFSLGLFSSFWCSFFVD